MAGEFNNRNLPSLPDGPSPHVYMLTAADTDLAKPLRAIRAGGAGNIQITCLNGAVEVITVAAGELVPAAILRVWATNTTATALLAYE